MKHRPRSVRFLLTLWYLGVLAATLGGFGAILYWNVASNLNRSVNESLVFQADAAAAALSAFWEADQKGQGNWDVSPSDTFMGEIEKGGLPRLARRWAERTGHLKEERLLRLADRYGQTLVSSGDFDRLGIGLTPGIVERVRRGGTHYQTLRLPRQRFRVATRPITEGSRVLFLVQAAVSLYPMEATLGGLRFLLGWLIPLVLAATGAVGWFLAGAALRPVGRMVAQVREIGAKEMDKRVDAPGTGDELEQLAETFNDLLSRKGRAFRQLRQFSAAASHELRTPLTAMKGELEVTLRRIRQPQEYRQALEAHLKMVDEISQTVEELLALARSEAVEGLKEWQPVELAALVEHVSDGYRPLVVPKAIHLEVSAQPPVWVRGEKRLLERLVSNLLDNAIRHTPAQGSVAVRADHWRDKACLMVQDTGPGIPSQEVPYLFDRFFQKKQASENAHSTGIGLGLCRWIVEAHRGRLEVSSPTGQGAIFTVWLPLAASPG